MWTRFVSRLTWGWRRLWGKCILCGGNAIKMRLEHGSRCYHCYDGERLHLCHFCFKAWSHGKNFGMSSESLVEMFEKEVLGG